MYTLAVPAVSNWSGGLPRVAYVDGSPSATSLVGVVNELVWEGAGNQFELAEAGLVRALRDVASGDE